MDPERAREFILERHGRTVTVLHDLALRQDKFDQQLRAYARLGLRWKRELDERIKRLTAVQERTEESLKALIESMRKGRNGH